jgi:hypothetical protein
MILNFVYVGYELANNGLQLQKIGDFGKKPSATTEPPISYRCCYGLFLFL